MCFSNGVGRNAPKRKCRLKVRLIRTYELGNVHTNLHNGDSPLCHPGPGGWPKTGLPLTRGPGWLGCRRHCFEGKPFHISTEKGKALCKVHPSKASQHKADIQKADQHKAERKGKPIAKGKPKRESLGKTLYRQMPFARKALLKEGKEGLSPFRFPSFLCLPTVVFPLHICAKVFSLLPFIR